MTTVEKLTKAKEDLMGALSEHSKATERMKLVEIGQEVYISGTHGWDIEYYPCIVKEKNEKELTLNLYEQSIKQYHNNVDVNNVYFESELNG